jgi:integrase/recombinase XerC
MEQPITLLQLEAWLAEMLTSKQAAGRSPRTVKWYADEIGAFLRWLRTQPARAPLALPTLEAYLVALGTRELAPHTRHGKYRALRLFLGWIAKRQRLPAVHELLLDLPKQRAPVKAMRAVSLGEFNQLLGAIQPAGWIDWRDWRDRSLLLLLFWSGLRIGELAALQAEDFDQAAQTVLVRSGKGGKARLSFFHPALTVELAAYFGARPDHSTVPLWVSSDGYRGVRGAMTVDGMRQMVERRSVQASLGRLSPHAFRHGFACHLLNSGAELSAVSALLGHFDSGFTARTYAKWNLSGLRRQYLGVVERPDLAFVEAMRSERAP